MKEKNNVNYICPKCKGGFNKPKQVIICWGNIEYQCPWCGKNMIGLHER